MIHVLIFISVYSGNIWQNLLVWYGKMSLCNKNYLFPFRYLQVRPTLILLQNSVKHQPCFSLQRYCLFFFFFKWLLGWETYWAQEILERSFNSIQWTSDMPLAITNIMHIREYLMLFAAFAIIIVRSAPYFVFIL